MEHPGSGPSPIQGKPLLFGTVHGSIGLIGQLSTETYSLLSRLQENMAKAVTSVGHISHDVYPRNSNLGNPCPYFSKHPEIYRRIE